MKSEEITIRDPYIYTDKEKGSYYLFGTTDQNCWSGPGVGFDCYRSTDLTEWEGPIPAFRPEPGFWATTQFWAPEMHAYQGRYYLFATFKAEQAYRGTQILVADQPEGPYRPWSDGPVTPPDWECLDGTLHVDEEGQPWMVFCHEWVQIDNGAMYAMPLTADLRERAGRPVFLFNASEAPWVVRPAWPEKGAQHQFPTYVTDGPFLHRTKDGVLLMLWSSLGEEGYAMGIARSESGQVKGPWVQEPEPLWSKDGGHGMIFRTLGDELMLTLHQPNTPGQEHPRFFALVDEGDGLRL